MRSRQRTTVSVRWFCILGSSLFHLLRCLYQVVSHCIYLEETQESWNTCSEMAASSLCIYCTATSFMMPENRDLMKNFVKYAVSQEPVIAVVSKPPKKGQFKTERTDIACKEVKLSQFINTDILIKVLKLTHLAISSIPVQHIYPKPQGRKDGVSNLIGSMFFITPYSSWKAWHALLDSFISFREDQMSLTVLFSLEDLSVQQAVLMASGPPDSWSIAHRE